MNVLSITDDIYQRRMAEQTNNIKYLNSLLLHSIHSTFMYYYYIDYRIIKIPNPQICNDSTIILEDRVKKRKDLLYMDFGYLIAYVSCSSD